MRLDDVRSGNKAVSTLWVRGDGISLRRQEGLKLIRPRERTPAERKVGPFPGLPSTLVLIAAAMFWKVVTWLILPVVICLSQRLSHACLSINNFVL